MFRGCSLFFSVVAAILLTGCGGKDEPQEEAKAEKAQVVPRRMQAAAQPAPQARKRLEPRTPPKKEEPPKEEENPIDPATDPNDIFVIGESALEFDVAGEAPMHPDTDLFAVTVPGSGDFTRFDARFPKREEAAAPSAKPALPAGFSPIPSAGFADSGLPWRIRCEKDQSIMALIPAGTSPMGKEGGPKESSPMLNVYLENFYIDTTEVTLAQYELFRKSVKEEKGRTLREALNAESPPDHPVLGAPWTEITFYTNWCGKELPNEAEWEKAARTDQGFDYPWGAGRPLWGTRRVVEQIDAVKSHRTDKSPYGVYDLAGNAREWCIDYFSPTVYAEASKEGAVVRGWKGPVRPPNKELRVVRGGSPDWAAWYRTGVDSKDREQQIGFRCVLRIPGSASTR